MKVAIEVVDRTQAKAVKVAMDDAAVRAFVIVMGILMQLDTDRARRRVLNYVLDQVDEQVNAKLAAELETVR